MPPEAAKKGEEGQAPKEETKVTEPGATDPNTGKYTDEGLAELLKKLKTEGTEESNEGDKGKEDKKESKKDDQMIPKSRFDEVINERNRLREQLQGAPKKEEPPSNKAPSVDDLRKELATKRKEWQKAIFDNDQDTADNLLSEMDQLEVNIDEARLSESESMTRALSADDVRYDALLEQLQEQYPIINKGSDDFDQKVVSEMFDMREAYIARGFSQTDALKKARDYILKPLGPTKPNTDTQNERSSNSRKNLADALTRQPPNAADLGAPADAGMSKLGIDISRLTPEQFDKLDEETKAELRGDKLTEEHMKNR